MSTVKQRQVFDNWYEALQDIHGRFSKDELRWKLETVDDRLNFCSRTIPAFLNYIEDKDDINITRGCTGANGTRYFVHTGYTLEPYLDQVPDEYDDTLRELVGQGVSPKSVVAAVDLLEDRDGRTQKEVALDNDVCEVTVRNVRDKIQEHRSNSTENNTTTGDTE